MALIKLTFVKDKIEGFRDISSATDFVFTGDYSDMTVFMTELKVAFKSHIRSSDADSDNKNTLISIIDSLSEGDIKKMVSVGQVIQEEK